MARKSRRSLLPARNARLVEWRVSCAQKIASSDCRQSSGRMGTTRLVERHWGDGRVYVRAEARTRREPRTAVEKFQEMTVLGILGLFLVTGLSRRSSLRRRIARLPSRSLSAKAGHFIVIGPQPCLPRGAALRGRNARAAAALPSDLPTSRMRASHRASAASRQYRRVAHRCAASRDS